MGIVDWFRFSSAKDRQKVSGLLTPGALSVDTTLPSIAAMGGELARQMGMVTPPVTKEAINVLVALSIANPLLSETIYDSVLLGNSGHFVIVEAGSDAAIAAAQEQLDALSRRMHVGGAGGWFNVAFYQMLVTGALSHEWVVANDLKGLDRSKFVPVQSIKFFVSGNNDGRFVVKQRALGQDVELNPLTYDYRSILQYENNPHAIPPFYSAIEPVWIQRHVMAQIRGISRKFGLMGLIRVLMTMPGQDFERNESDTAYRERLTQYLEDATKQFDGKLSEGFLVGYKEDHDFEHFPVTGDARGLSDLWDRVDMQAHSGANTDPSLHGRQYSRTETQIRVVYKKTIRQLKTIRSIAGDSLERGYLLHLLLAGVQVDGLELMWEPIDALDEAKDEEAYALRIANAEKLWALGIINKDQMAQMLGYEAPASDESESAPADEEVGSGGARRRSARFAFRDGKYVAVLPRIEPAKGAQASDAAGPSTFHDWPPDDPVAPAHQGYATFASVDGIIDEYVATIAHRVGVAERVSMATFRLYLKRAAGRIAPDIFAERAYRVLADAYGGSMNSEAMRDAVNGFVEQIYRENRLGAGFAASVKPLAGDFKPIFDVRKDTATVKFLQDTDFMYLGKYVERGDTAARLKRRIANEYIAVGRDWSDKAFINGVADAMGAEAWQAERVVRTTATMSRNLSAMRTFEQIKVVRHFGIAGPDDRLTCDWCLDMMGREFDVAKTIVRMEGMISAGPELLPETHPFLVGELTADELGELTDSEIQNAGYELPPYHPSCRHFPVART